MNLVTIPMDVSVFGSKDTRFGSIFKRLTGSTRHQRPDDAQSPPQSNLNDPVRFRCSTGIDAVASTETAIDDILRSPSSSKISETDFCSKENIESKIGEDGIEKQSNDVPSPPPKFKLLGRIWLALQPFMTAPSIALVVSLVVANVQILKALFIPVLGYNSIGNAPDDKPPLDFIMEITRFAGPCVPVLGLILLGAIFSRLSIKSLPKGFWKSIVAMAVLKLVVGLFFPRIRSHRS